MGRSVICDEKLLDILERVPANGYTPGLILGQFAGQKDYVIHLPLTPKPLPQDDGCDGDVDNLSCTFQNVEDIEDNFLSQHAKTVTRMLSGGMWVLGFYVVGPGDIFANKNTLAKLKSLAYAIHNCTKGNVYLHGTDPTNQKLIFHFSSLSKKFVCKCLDMSSLSSSLRPADWKFKSHVTRWLKVESSINLSWLLPFRVPKTNKTTKKRLQECLIIFEKHLDSLVYNINGQFCPGDVPLLTDEQSRSKENNDEETSFQLMFFEFSESTEILLPDKEELENSSQIGLCGLLGSRVFVHEKSTADDAAKAVREDLLRTLASRLEMHWQTFDEAENNNRIKSLPRRVFFTPEDSDVAFSEYIFEGEVEEDAVAAISENLGLMKGITDAIEGLWELPEESALKSSDDVDGSKTKNNEGLNELLSNKPLLLGFIAAGLILILSIFIHFFYS